MIDFSKQAYTQEARAQTEVDESEGGSEGRSGRGGKGVNEGSTTGRKQVAKTMQSFFKA